MSESLRELMTMREAAAEIGVSVGRAYQLAAEGRIPAVRLSPRRIRVPRRALDAWIAQQTELALASMEGRRE